MMLYGSVFVCREIGAKRVPLLWRELRFAPSQFGLARYTTLRALRAWPDDLSPPTQPTFSFRVNQKAIYLQLKMTNSGLQRSL